MTQEETKDATAETTQASQPLGKAKARKRHETPTYPCSCGCGQQTKGAWAPGHDAKLWGVAHRVASGKLTPEEARKLLAAFPPETVKANKDQLNALAEVPVA